MFLCKQKRLCSRKLEMLLSQENPDKTHLLVRFEPMTSQLFGVQSARPQPLHIPNVSLPLKKHLGPVSDTSGSE